MYSSYIIRHFELEILTYVRIENFLKNQLEELLRNSSLIYTLLPLKLNVELLLQVRGILHGDHLQLQHRAGFTFPTLNHTECDVLCTHHSSVA